MVSCTVSAIVGGRMIRFDHRVAKRVSSRVLIPLGLGFLAGLLFNACGGGGGGGGSDVLIWDSGNWDQVTWG